MEGSIALLMPTDLQRSIWRTLHPRPKLILRDAVRNEGIFANHPLALIVLYKNRRKTDRFSFRIMLAVVEDDFKHPILVVVL